jgi:hypothetical protein
MADQASSASEWTSAVEAAVRTEMLRRQRRLKWAVLLSLLVGVLAVALAVALRGVTWQELDARLQARLAPLIRTQVTQGEVQIAMAAELQRLEADVRTLRAELLAQRDASDPAVASLRWRLQRLERALNEATADRMRLERRIDQNATRAPPQ